MFTETWLHPNINNNEFLPDNYEAHRRDCPGDPHGGVLLAIKKELNSQNLDWAKDANNHSPDTELVFAKIADPKVGSIIMGCCYRPPSAGIEYANSMSTSIREVASRNPTATLWIGGDFNLPDIQWDKHLTTCAHNTKAVNESYMNMFEDISLSQLVEFPTRGSNILDLFFSNRPTLVNRIEPMPGVSDHDTMVYIDTNVRPFRQRPIKRKILLWKNADLDKLQSSATTLSKKLTDNYTVNTRVNILWESFKSGVDNISDQIPSKMTTTRYNQPWVNRKIKRLATKKQRAYNKARTTKCDADWARFKRLTKAQRIECRNAYNSHIMDIISPEIHQRPKRFWGFIKSRRCDNNGVAPLRGQDGLTYSDPKTKADILNKQFSSVFTQEPQDIMPDLGESPYPTMPDIIIHTGGVIKLLRNIKPHKAAGPDNISARILKETADQLAPALSLVFQASLMHGCVPDDWKLANVAPIFKKGDRSKASNYRPVSLTCISCKILEHIVSSNVMSHLEAHNILTDAQHGFRRRRSCETQLILTVQDLAQGIEDKQQIDVILLDFSKAFDKVPHRRLLHKLDYYGVRGRNHQWIAHFLHCREQTVALEGASSPSAPVTSGVPQGTVLGPLLFLVYINDLPTNVTHSNARLFADDCIVYKIIRTQEDAAKLQEDLNRLQDWERTWMMQFHPDKCQLLRITNKRNVIQADYQIHDQSLSQADEAKYLGVKIQNKLSWSTHIAEIARKADHTRAFLQRNMRACPFQIRAQCYTTLVRPILEYSSPVWDPHLQKDINCLEMVQRRSARFAYQNFSRESSVTKMLSYLQWDPLAERRAQAKVCMLYKASNGLVAIPITDYLRVMPATIRGHDMRYFLAYCRTTTLRHSFFPDAARLWNKLPSSSVAAPSIEAFKTSLQGRMLL